jgi:acetyl-CoA decarbonylase/synthase complex subunit gamma
VELTLGAKYAFIAAAIFALPAGWRQGNWAWSALRTEGTTAALSTLGGFLFAGIAIPALLPWLPGRAFGIKGAVGGLLAWLLLWALGIYSRPIDLIAWLLLLGSTASLVGLNFTGASTYTSLSGVKKETRLGVPLMAAGLLASLVVWLYACRIL